MSLARFQSLLAELVIDDELRARVQRRGEDALADEDLSARERRRLAAAARDPGIDVTVMMYEGFRFGRVIHAVPLLRALLGEARLGAEIRRFWKSHPPVSVYYLGEALAFCEYLRGRLGARGLRSTYLPEVLEYQRATLLLQHRDPSGRERSPLRVRFRHDPFRLIPALRRGERPRGVPIRPITLRGARTPAGVSWRACSELDEEPEDAPASISPC